MNLILWPSRQTGRHVLLTSIDELNYFTVEPKFYARKGDERIAYIQAFDARARLEFFFRNNLMFLNIA